MNYTKIILLTMIMLPPVALDYLTETLVQSLRNLLSSCWSKSVPTQHSFHCHRGQTTAILSLLILKARVGQFADDKGSPLGKIYK